MPGSRPRAQNAIKTHCANGHPFEGSNLILKRRVGYTERVCRKCRYYQENARRSRVRRRGRS